MSEDRAASGSTSLDLGDRTEAWDAGAARKALSSDQYGKAFFWRDPNGDPKTLADYKLPFASPSGGLHAVWRGVTAAAAAIQGSQGGVDIPSGDVAGVKRKIEAYYAKARDKYSDDTIRAPWDNQNSRSLDGATRFAVAPITHVDVRDASASHGFWTMSGYAAVFNQPTTLYNGKFVRQTESIASTAFDRLLRDQPLDQPDGVVHFNLGHDMNRSVAATDVPAGQPGSLQLRADPQGLFFMAKVPTDDPDGVAMAAKMRSGVLRQASFAFTVADADTTYIEADGDGPDIEHRTILEMKHLYDVCATPQGAYAQTVSGLRSLAAVLGQPELGDPFTRQPALGDENPASPLGGSGDIVNSDLERWNREAEKAVAEARARFKPRKRLSE